MKHDLWNMSSVAHKNTTSIHFISMIFSYLCRASREKWQASSTPHDKAWKKISQNVCQPWFSGGRYPEESYPTEKA